MNTYSLNDMIDTPYGKARIVAKTADDTQILVSLPKENMTKPHPNYRGGNCVNFFYRPSKISELIGKVTT